MIRFLTILLLSLSLTGCAAIIGGAVGASVADNDDALEYYLTANNPPSHIASAMKNKEITEDMTPKQVRIVMSADGSYDTRPNTVMKVGETEKWVYDYRKDQYHENEPPTYIIKFKNGEVIEHSPPDKTP